MLQLHRTIELCFSSLWLLVEISGMVSMIILIKKGLLELLLYLIKNGNMAVCQEDFELNQIE